MIRATLTPQNTTLSLSIPKEYVGKQLELLLYAVEEVKNQALPASKKVRPSDFAGTLSKEAADVLLKGIEESRKEWEIDI